MRPARPLRYPREGHADSLCDGAGVCAPRTRAHADQRSRTQRTPESILTKQCFFLDMDGVVYHGDRLLPGVKEFVAWLEAEKKQYLFLTNGSVRTPAEIQAKLRRLGLEVPPDVFHTSAIATAMFLQSQVRARWGDAPCRRGLPPAAVSWPDRVPPISLSARSRGRAVARSSATDTQWLGVRRGRQRPAHSTARGWVHAHRHRPRLCRGGRNESLHVRHDRKGHQSRLSVSWGQADGERTAPIGPSAR